MDLITILVFIGGFILGFFSSIGVLLYMGRKQLREALKPFKIEKQKRKT